MIRWTETQTGWRLSIDNGAPIDLTEEQLFRLRQSIERKFGRTESIRRMVLKAWKTKRFSMVQSAYEYVVRISVRDKGVTVEVEAFIRALTAAEQTEAREYFARLGYKKDEDNEEEAK